jgi:hypothetical protein
MNQNKVSLTQRRVIQRRLQQQWIAIAEVEEVPRLRGISNRVCESTKRRR